LHSLGKRGSGRVVSIARTVPSQALTPRMREAPPTFDVAVVGAGPAAARPSRW
jgi:hypothetical protein